MEKTGSQGCGEKQVLQAQQDHEESQDSKGKLAMLASLDRRVNLDLQVHQDNQADRDTMVIPAPQELRDDLDPLATLVLQVHLDHQDLPVHQEWE